MEEPREGEQDGARTTRTGSSDLDSPKQILGLEEEGSQQLLHSKQTKTKTKRKTKAKPNKKKRGKLIKEDRESQEGKGSPTKAGDTRTRSKKKKNKNTNKRDQDETWSDEGSSTEEEDGEGDGSDAEEGGVLVLYGSSSCFIVVDVNIFSVSEFQQQVIGSYLPSSLISPLRRTPLSWRLPLPLPRRH